MNNEKKSVPDVWGSGRKLPDNWGKSNIDSSSGSPWSANKKTMPTQGNLKSPVWGNSENANNADSIPDKNKTTISQNSLNESVQSVDSENESQLFEGIFDEGQEKCDLGENANCLSDSVPVENNDEGSESAPLIDNHLVAEENVSENLKYDNDDLLQGNGNVQKSFVNIDLGNDDSDIKSYLSKAREAIKKGDWSSAKDYCQFAIKIDTHNPLPYLYLVLSFEKLNSIEQLGNIAKKDGLLRNHNYSTALSYSNDSQKVLLSNYNMQSIYNYYKLQESNFIDDRERFILSTDLYRRIYLFMNSEVFPDKSHEKGLEYLYYLSRSALISAKCFSEFDHVSGMFKQISEYSDSLEMAEQCYEVYSQSIRTLIDSDDTTIEEIEDALSDLSKANGLTSAEILVQECQEKLDILRNEEKDLYYNELYERSQKRSKLIRNTFFGFVGIIVVLFAAKVVVTEISLIKNSSNKSQNNADVIVESTPDTDFVETTLVTSKATEKTETIQTTIVTEAHTEETFVKQPIQNKTISDNAYGEFLSQKYTELKNSEEYAFYDISDNEFAICDIDNDGYEELLLNLTSGSMASYALQIYDCSSGGEVTLKQSVYPGSTFYENGTITIPISHNQGLAGSFWPYSVMQYNPSSDSYSSVGSVDAWDKSAFSRDFDGNLFPDSYDTSNSGILYYINADGYNSALPVDKEVYEQWRNSWIGNGKELSIDYQKLTEANIKALNPEFSTNEVALSKDELGIMYNLFYIDTLSSQNRGGFIEDWDGDGIDDLICVGIYANYYTCIYNNGETVHTSYNLGSNYTEGDFLPSTSTKYYSESELRKKCLEMAIENGYTANQNFIVGPNYAVGYVKTADLKGTLNLRSAPSTDSSVITQLPNGMLFNVIDSLDNSGGSTSFYGSPSWYYITVNYNGENYSGYVSADYVVTRDLAI